jgi:ATP-dependent DNA helicase RecG
MSPDTVKSHSSHRIIAAFGFIEKTPTFAHLPFYDEAHDDENRENEAHDEAHDGENCENEAHDEAHDDENREGEAHDEAHDDKNGLSDMEIAILGGCAEIPQSTPELLQLLGYKQRTGNFKRAVSRLIGQLNLLEPTLPNASRSKNQKYRLTAKGKATIATLKNGG